MRPTGTRLLKPSNCLFPCVSADHTESLHSKAYVPGFRTGDSSNHQLSQRVSARSESCPRSTALEEVTIKMVHRIAQLTRLLPALWSIGGEAFRPLTGHSFSVQSHDVTALNARRLWTHDVSSTKVGVGWTLLRATVASEADIPSKGPPTKSRPHIQSKPNADSRSVEREVAHLGRIGKTNDALALYWSVWEADHDNRLTVRAKPTTRLMNAAIDACARAKPPRTEEARRILSKGMDGGDSGIRRLSPNVYTFGALMSVMTRARDSNGALRLLRSMQVRDANLNPHPSS